MNHSQTAWRRLAYKYRTLAQLRRDRAGGGDVAPRAVLQTLANEFPGVLRELETLTMPTLESRAFELEAAADGEQPPHLWMQIVLEWHAHWREALALKRHPRAAPSGAAKGANQAMRWTGREGEVPQARVGLHARIEARIAEVLGVSRDVVAETLRPPSATLQTRGAPAPRS